MIRAAELSALLEWFIEQDVSYASRTMSPQ